MFCTNCGSELKDNVVFCTNCGQKVAENPDAQRPFQSNEAFNPIESSVKTVSVQEMDVKRQSAPLDEKVFLGSTLLNEPPAQGLQNFQDVPIANKYALQENPRSSGLSVAAIVSIIIAAIAVVSAIVIIFFVIKPFGSTGTTTVTTVQGQASSNSSAASGSDVESELGDKAVEPSSAFSASASSNSSKSNEAADESPIDDPDGYILPDSKTHVYKKSELKDLSNY